MAGTLRSGPRPRILNTDGQRHPVQNALIIVTLLSGLVSFVFGVLLFARPGVGAVTLALLFGLYALIYGFSQITAGVQLRQVGAGV